MLPANPVLQRTAASLLQSARLVAAAQQPALGSPLMRISQANQNTAYFHLSSRALPPISSVSGHTTSNAQRAN
jgi:hypothetical protein